MDPREDGVRKGPAAATYDYETVDGELSGQEHVDLGGQGSRGLGGGDLSSQDLFGPGGGVSDSGGVGSAPGGDRDARPRPRPRGLGVGGHAAAPRDLDNAFDAPGTAFGGGGARLTRPLFFGAEHIGGAGPAPSGRRGDPNGAQRGPFPVLARGLPADFRRGDRGGVMRHLALLFLLLGAMALTGAPGVPWLHQFGALLAWLAGCILLFFSLQ